MLSQHGLRPAAESCEPEAGLDAPNQAVKPAMASNTPAPCSNTEAVVASEQQISKRQTAAANHAKSLR